MNVFCPRCDRHYDDETHWTLCPHARRPGKRARPTQPSLSCAGAARPSSPKPVYGEDFSLLIRSPRRLRLARTQLRVLS